MSRPSRIFPSIFLGGFECSSHQRPDGRRLDLIEATAHDRCAGADYRALREHGISTARDGLRWHLIERSPGRYDWTSALPMVRAAQSHGVQVIWDLCHYGLPDWLDVWSDEFPSRFADFAAASAIFIQQETAAPPFLCPVNEISYWAWAGGEVGHFLPVTLHRGGELKRQLVRACIAAIAGVRAVVPQARFLHAEPTIHVEPGLPLDQTGPAARAYREAQFEALDMVSGRRAPELGGNPSCLDIVGVNFYPDNQWYHHGSTIPLGHHAFQPLRALLAEIHARYQRPLIISETGAENTAKASWLHYVGAEVRAAQRAGTPVEGICLYPILDYPGWNNDRHCEVGLFSAPLPDGRRLCRDDFAEEIQIQRLRFGESDVVTRVAAE